jgi:adenosylcobinamide-GDP ribazoletransferase
MNILRSFAMAFSMFSKIPMPTIDWKPESMRYMFCVFPLVGAVAGAIAGYFIQVSELAMLIGLVVVQAAGKLL